MRRFIFGSAFAALTFLVPLSARASEPVYVVRVEGAAFDAAHLRAALGRELHAEILAPEDPRAESADGSIVVRASPSDQKLTVTFRKAGAPVTRTVSLPAEPTRAESTAVLLGGNLARDEAGDVLNGLGARPREPATPTGDDDAALRDLARMRKILADTASDARAYRLTVGIGALAVGAAFAATGAAVIWTADPPPARHFGVGMIVSGGVLGLLGGLELGSISDAERLRERFDEESSGSSPASVVERVEDDWRKKATSARASRKTAGTILMVLGVAGIAATGTFAIVEGPHQSEKQFDGLSRLAGASAFVGVLGAGIAFIEGPLETSYRTWHATRPVAVTPLLAPTASGGIVGLQGTF